MVWSHYGLVCVQGCRDMGQAEGLADGGCEGEMMWLQGKGGVKIKQEWWWG